MTVVKTLPLPQLRALWALGPRQAAVELIRLLLYRQAFTFFERCGVHVLPVHYETPVPDTRDLRRRLPQWYREGAFPGVDFDLPGQLALLDRLRCYEGEWARLPTFNELAARGLGIGYGEVEAHLLHASLRHYRPRHMIEVGSGVSTVVAAAALAMNGREDGTTPTLLCVEPYPRPALQTLAAESGGCQIRVLSQHAQDVPVEVFQQLGERDILFIDSSHIAKLGSDVTYLILDVLPALQRGVAVQVHDIPYPYPTPDPELWIFKRHLFWSEAALLQAFLSHNAAYRILLCASYLHHKAPQTLAAAFPMYDAAAHYPTAIWLQKVG